VLDELDRQTAAAGAAEDRVHEELGKDKSARQRTLTQLLRGLGPGRWGMSWSPTWRSWRGGRQAGWLECRRGSRTWICSPAVCKTVQAAVTPLCVSARLRGRLCLIGALDPAVLDLGLWAARR
jgi:hypothetical protein